MTLDYIMADAGDDVMLQKEPARLIAHWFTAYRIFAVQRKTACSSARA